MCTYIMTVLPAGTDLDRAKKEYKQFGLRFWVREERPPTISPHDFYVGTAKHCDCGTALGSAYIPPSPMKSPEEHIPKLKKRGWSQAKIERWLAEKRAHSIDSETALDEGTIQQLARWHAFIEHVLQSRLASRLGIFVHFYNERFGADIIRQIERVPLSRVTPELLRNMADDTLYEFVPDRVPA